MLNTLGFFKELQCPYEKLKQCQRPYCHFKHVEESDKVSWETEEFKCTSDGSVASDDDMTVDDVDPAEEFNGSLANGVTFESRPTEVGPSLVEDFSVPSTSSYSYEPTVPEYNPTPISRLKVNFSQSRSKTRPYSPEYPRKKKKTEEYDPTVVKFTNKKSVTFGGLPPSEGYSAAFSSDEEDFDDSASAPKFSDDEVEDVPKAPSPEADETPEKEEVEDNAKKKEEEKVDEFSLVDKILVDCKKNDELFISSKKPVPAKVIVAKKTKSTETMKKTKETPHVRNDVYDCVLDRNISKEAGIAPNFDLLADAMKGATDDIKSEQKKIDTEQSGVSKVKKSSNDKEKLVSKSGKSSSKLDAKEKHSKDSSSKPDSHLKHGKSSSDSSAKVEKKSEKHKSSSESSKKDKTKSDDVKIDLDKKKKKDLSSTEEKSSKTKSGLLLTEKKSSKSNSESSSVDKKSSKSKPDLLSKNAKSSKSDFSSSDEKTSKSKDSKHKKAHHDSPDPLSSKLQDEKVSSSSKAKKSKHELSSKVSSKSSDTTLKNKHETDSKELLKSKKSKMNSDSESASDKNLHRNKLNSLNETPLEDENADSSMDECVDDVILSDDSDADINEECWNIFNETYPQYKDSSANCNSEELPNEAKAAFQDLTIMRKRRLAHSGASDFKKPSSVKKTEVKISRNPAQVMMDRFAQVRAAQMKMFEEKEKAAVSKSEHIYQNDKKTVQVVYLSPSFAQQPNTQSQNNIRQPLPSSPGRSDSKPRISMVPNHSLLAAITEKNRLASKNDFSPLPSTVSKTLKVTKRVAHVPDMAIKPRPVIPADYGSKVPTVVRQKFLNAFIDEYLKFSLTEDEAYDNSLEEEKKAYQRSSSKAIYMNVASNALNRLRQLVKSSASDGKTKEGVSSTTKTVSHETVLNGPRAQRTSFSIERKKPAPIPELKGRALYDHLATYLLSEEQLKENGYPMPHPTETSRAVIEGIYAKRTQYCNDQFKRTCSRCQKTYYVNVDGDYVRDEECDYHWGRLWKKRIAGAFESRYTCCQGDAETEGCCVSPGHVFEGSEVHALKGYVKTLPKTPPPDRFYGIYALDCEMCYTTAGVELTRVSVVDQNVKTVYETFVRPQNKVLDYNTRFSGITEENLKSVRTTIRDVQAVLLCMFSDKTILIGHSLESDFKALKIFHKSVVDTSVVFPHKMGLPYKRALRTLVAENLNKIIQNDVGGHDSIEDAASCMELMLWKVKEDLKDNR